MFDKDIQKLWPQSHRAVCQQNMIINSPDVKTLKVWHVYGILLIFFSIRISSLVHTCICIHDVRLKGLASGHKDHPYIVYMWVGMFNDILIIIWNKQWLHLLKLFVVFQFVLQGLITILHQMKQWAVPTPLLCTTLQMQVIPRWRKVTLLTFYVICHIAFESTVIGQEL